MVEPTLPQEHSAGDAGLIEHLRSLAASLAGYFHARLQLAALESKEAIGHYLLIIFLLAAGAIVVVFGYIFVSIGLVFLLQYLTGFYWVWIMLFFGFAHFAIAAACAAVAYAKFEKPMFSTTINEFKKDQEWLTTSTKTN